jgi:hypothetical protein
LASFFTQRFYPTREALIYSIENKSVLL